jgi:hypothetical protein
MEDLKYASSKISVLEKLSKEQEWKWKHNQYDKTYSALMYISINLIILYGLYRLAKFLVTRWRRCKTPRVTAATTDHLSLPAEACGTGNVVNISIKTSNESLTMNFEAIPLQDTEGSSVRDSTANLQRSKRVKTTNHAFQAKLKCKLVLF